MEVRGSSAVGAGGWRVMALVMRSPPAVRFLLRVNELAMAGCVTPRRRAASCCGKE